MVRFKNRYITVEIVCPTVSEKTPLQLKPGIFHSTVLHKVQQIHGDFGVAAIKSGFLTKYCNESTRIAIIRVRHGPHRFVTSSLPFVKTIGKLNVRLNTLHVGATLKHTFKFIQKFQRAYLDARWVKLKTPEERQQLEQAVLDFTKTDVKINIENIT
ncbi:ribonuclease P/MRP protein subunit POP5 [Bombyx mandarina]|uniref:Ribonuclease P/MRP protein subunit POP5 n=2 Tax=Bombyx TaxID=7090 RepID=A0A8R2APQ6_BOMMO|nr:ribonuclease P/MRP protein subunit POP5 [Bombyx mori]XP_028038099.1 ribonuclease P/MRP protein subunit POP5 [Bombyx mandarina]